MDKTYNYRLTSNEASLILALLKIEIDHQGEVVKSCEEDGDDECQRVAEKRLGEMQTLYDNLREQHLSRFKKESMR